MIESTEVHDVGAEGGGGHEAGRGPVPAVRSALYVPADRADFLARADERGADALVLDLEDAITAGARAEARDRVRAWLLARPAGSSAIFVRLSAHDGPGLDDDLDAVLQPGLTGVVVPKVRSAAEVRALEGRLAVVERRRRLPEGSVVIWPLVETPEAVRAAYEIAATSPRIAYMGGATGEEGDLAAALGFQWTPGGLETLFLRSKVLVDVRAAGVPNPVTGMVTRLDVDEVRAFALRSRELGYEGMVVVHPDHVPVVNDVFTPSPEEVERARRVIQRLQEAEAVGRASIAHEGRMIDAAMVRTALSTLRVAARGVAPDAAPATDPAHQEGKP